MKIKSIHAAPITNDRVLCGPEIPKADWYNDAIGRGGIWTPNRIPPWGHLACVVTAEDGTWGLGMTSNAGPVASIINDHYAAFLTGEDCMATEKLWTLMADSSVHYSAAGIAGYAISAVDLALWDLKGKLLDTPVYSLLGGPTKDAIFCYATGEDFEWYKELGFRAAKLGLPASDAHDPSSLSEVEEPIAAAREVLGPDRDLMLDFYAASSNQDFIVRLAERLRPYHLKWIEDYLLPEDLEGYRSVRRRLPWQTLASGERWYALAPFSAAAAGHMVDIMQPDIRYAGGMTACVKIGHLAEAAGIQVMPHLAAGDSYGQHLAFGMSVCTWAEFLIINAAGEPMHDGYRTNPGMAFPRDGMLVPSDAPGFGIELSMSDIEEATR